MNLKLIFRLSIQSVQLQSPIRAFAFDYRNCDISHIENMNRLCVRQFYRTCYIKRGSNMGLCVIKPVFRGLDQAMLKPACSATETT